MHAVRLADGRRLVLRRYVWEEFRRAEPHAPARELEALDYAGRHRLPVPVVAAADVTGDDVGDGVSTILMSRLDGRAYPSPNLRQLAALAADLHRVPAAGFEHHYYPWCRDTSTRPPTGCRNPTLWQRALEIWHTGERPYQPRFVHRDFHPGNVLWLRGRLSGLVDWADACAGPVGVDIATCRWNLAGWAGPAAGNAFVSTYEHLTEDQHHPYWDIAKIVEDDWDLIDAPERIAQAELFLTQAIGRWNHLTRPDSDPAQNTQLARHPPGDHPRESFRDARQAGSCRYARTRRRLCVRRSNLGDVGVTHAQALILLPHKGILAFTPRSAPQHPRCIRVKRRTARPRTVRTLPGQ